MKLTKTPPKSLASSRPSSEDAAGTPTPQAGTPPFGFPYPAATLPRWTADSAPASFVEKLPGLGDVDAAFSKYRIDELSKLVTQVDEKPSFSDPDGTMLKKSKRIMTVVKILVMTILLGFK